MAYDTYKDRWEHGGKIVVKLYCDCMATYDAPTRNRMWFEDECVVISEEEAAKLRKAHKHMKPLWMFVHNTLVHPVMGMVELLTWDSWFPKWLDQLHDYTAKRAGFE